MMELEKLGDEKYDLSPSLSLKKKKGKEMKKKGAMKKGVMKKRRAKRTKPCAPQLWS